MAENPNRLGKAGYKKVQYTGSSSIAQSYTALRTTELHQVQIHLATAEDAESKLTLTITDTESATTEYDVEFFSQDMNGRTDFLQTFVPPIKILLDDKFTTAYLNDGSIATGITLILKEL